MEYITTSRAPLPNGHYSQAIKSGNLVFVSVQLPIDPLRGDETLSLPAEDQATIILRNIESIISECGCSREHLVRLTFYVTSIDFWGPVNDACVKFFGDHKPARGIVGVTSLHKGFLVAADAIASFE